MWKRGVLSGRRCGLTFEVAVVSGGGEGGDGRVAPESWRRVGRVGPGQTLPGGQGGHVTIPQKKQACMHTYFFTRESKPSTVNLVFANFCMGL